MNGFIAQRSSLRAVGGFICLCFAIGALVVTPQQSAADPYAALGEAEATAAGAAVDLQQDQRKLAVTVAKAKRIGNKANAASQKAADARAEVQAVKEQLVDQRLDAQATVDAQSSAFAKDAEKHDQQTAMLIGLGLGFLLLAAATWFYPQIKKSALVKRLARPGSDQKRFAVAAGITLLASFVLLASSGVPRSIGFFLLVATLGLSSLLFIAIRAVRPRADTETKKERRAPKWLIPALTAFFLLLFAGTTASGAFSSAPSEPEPAPEILEQAKAAEGNPAAPPTEELTDAVSKAAPLVVKAGALRKAEREARAGVRNARSAVRGTQRTLTRAKRSIRVNTKRVARLEAIAQREAARAAAQAAREQAAAAAAAAAAAPPSAPSYSSCATAPSDIPVPPGSPLDADGDGIGCES